MGKGRQRTTVIGPAGALAACLVCLLCAWPAAGGGDLRGRSAPDFVLKSITGDNLRLSEHQGSVVLLSFWAPWCGECREQLPRLDDLHGRYAAAGLRVLSVSIDPQSRRAADLVRGLQLSFPVLLDHEGGVARLYDPGKLPLTLLIDPAGTVRHVHEGYRADDARAYVTELEQLLADYGPLTDQG